MHTERTPRNPVLAALMSFMLPGFGQLYNGEVNKAIWLFLLFALVTVPAMALVALYLPDAWMMPALLLSLAMALALWLYSMIDAWRTARRSDAYVAQPWQCSGAYMLILILCNLFGLPLLVSYVRTHQVEPFRVPSSSMEPGIMPGDYFFADKRYNCPGCKGSVRRGDIALFVYPNNRTQFYIKRVIGLPGDRIHIRGADISVNAIPLTVQTTGADGNLITTEHDGAKQWQVRWTGADAPLPDADITVPSGQVFVMGDNRNISVDSRSFGTVPLADVAGKARQIWFSAGKDGVHWSRLGKVLE